MWCEETEGGRDKERKITFRDQKLGVVISFEMLSKIASSKYMVKPSRTSRLKKI